VRDVVGEEGFAREAPTVLNRDESALLGEIVNLLREARQADSLGVDKLVSILPSDSFVIRDVLQGIHMK